jgi:hypothetical protein
MKPINLLEGYMTCGDLEGWQMLIPICLMLIDQIVEKMANNFVGGFCLPVAMRIVSCKSAML